MTRYNAMPLDPIKSRATVLLLRATLLATSCMIAVALKQPTEGLTVDQASDLIANEQPLRLTNSDEVNALLYLQKYGYMNALTNSEANNLISEDSFSDAVKSFQKFAGINETGTIDRETLILMGTPRCGNSDKQTSISKRGNLRSFGQRVTMSRKKRYALQGSKWRRQELTYRISQYPTRFTGKRHEVDSQIEKAFGIWSQVAPIDFIVKREGKVHIDIRFASGEHGDGDAFDGPGNTLAHAYFPQYGGDAHFDDQEYWTVDSYAGTNIFQVAAHELGHSLGLGHSNVREALMAPFYQKYKPNFKLHMDDVLAIQALYGEKPYMPDDVPQSPSTSFSHHIPHIAPPPPISTTTSSPPTTTSSATQSIFPPRPTSRGRPMFFGGPKVNSDGRESNDDEASPVPDLNTIGTNGIGFGEDPTGFRGSGLNPRHPQQPADICIDSAIDAATRTEDGNSYVFKGDYYWLLVNEGLAKGYPRRIAADWDGLTGPIDAALTWADGKTFFFKGNKYWRFRNKRRDGGYPKLISSGFAGIPDNIDTAFVWSGNGRTYFFKGTEYWRFDSKADPPVSSEYPRSIKVWTGIPPFIDAAFKWDNNVTYFFKGNQYYRFNDKEFKVEPRGRPPFPRLTSEWWFGCIGSNLAQKALPIGLSLQNSESASLAIDTGERMGNLDPYLSNSPDSSREWSLLPANISGDSINSGLGTHVNDRSPSNSDEIIPRDRSAWNSTNALDSPVTRFGIPDHSIFGRSFYGDSASSSAISQIFNLNYLRLISQLYVPLFVMRNLAPGIF